MGSALFNSEHQTPASESPSISGKDNVRAATATATAYMCWHLHDGMLAKNHDDDDDLSRSKLTPVSLNRCQAFCWTNKVAVTATVTPPLQDKFLSHEEDHKQTVQVMLT